MRSSPYEDLALNSTIMSDFFTLNEAADRLGVHYMTAYRYVRLGQLPARKEGGTWRVSERDLELFQHGGHPDSSLSGSRRAAPWPIRLENRLLDGDDTGSWRVIEAALTAGLSPFDIYCEVMIPALTSIGEKWRSGDVSVGEEHMASALVGRLIGRLGPRFHRRGRRRGSVVVAGPPGERHSLNLAMAADVLRAAGYNVYDLGADLPVEDFETELVRLGPLKGVCVGVLHPDALSGCAAMVAAARRVIDPGTPIIVGGGAVSGHDEALRLGADSWADLRSVADAVEAGRDRTPPVSV